MNFSQLHALTSKCVRFPFDINTQLPLRMGPETVIIRVNLFVFIKNIIFIYLPKLYQSVLVDQSVPAEEQHCCIWTMYLTVFARVAVYFTTTNFQTAIHELPLINRSENNTIYCVKVIDLPCQCSCAFKTIYSSKKSSVTCLSFHIN